MNRQQSRHRALLNAHPVRLALLG